ncbi:hypothetical protein V8F20_012081 [Naviculisporaceae sp. PSN 640]
MEPNWLALRKDLEYCRGTPETKHAEATMSPTTKSPIRSQKQGLGKLGSHSRNGNADGKKTMRYPETGWKSIPAERHERKRTAPKTELPITVCRLCFGIKRTGKKVGFGVLLQRSTGIGGDDRGSGGIDTIPRGLQTLRADSLCWPDTCVIGCVNQPSGDEQPKTTTNNGTATSTATATIPTKGGKDWSNTTEHAWERQEEAKPVSAGDRPIRQRTLNSTDLAPSSC